MISKLSNHSPPPLPPLAPSSASAPASKALPEIHAAGGSSPKARGADGFDSPTRQLGSLLSQTAQLLGQVTQLLGSELSALGGHGTEVPDLGGPESSPATPAPSASAPATPAPSASAPASATSAPASATPASATPAPSASTPAASTPASATSASASQPSQTQAVGGASGVQGDYGVKQAVADLEKLSQNHKIGDENRGLGDAHRAEFDQNKQAIAEAAIDAARRYFPEMSVKDGTRLILSDAALESTFDPKLNAESGSVDPDKTVGLLQARGASNLADFKKFASPEGLQHADGSAWDPKTTPTNDLAKIWENIHVGAWYISTTARLGATSPNEHFDMGRDGPRTPDITTGLLSHFMGPGGAASDPNNQNPGGARYLRIVGGELDYLDPGTSQRILGSKLDPSQRV